MGDADLELGSSTATAATAIAASIPGGSAGGGGGGGGGGNNVATPTATATNARFPAPPPASPVTALLSHVHQHAVDDGAVAQSDAHQFEAESRRGDRNSAGTPFLGSATDGADQGLAATTSDGVVVTPAIVASTVPAVSGSDRQSRIGSGTATGNSRPNDAELDLLPRLGGGSTTTSAAVVRPGSSIASDNANHNGNDDVHNDDANNHNSNDNNDGIHSGKAGPDSRRGRAKEASLEPSWATAPGGHIATTMEVWKDRVVIDAIPLTLATTLFGRKTDAVDVPLEHPTVSRRQALVAHRLWWANGSREDSAVVRAAVFISDLGSSQGTFVNGVEIPADEFVELQDGDKVTFASSTRTYVVHIKLSASLARRAASAASDKAPVAGANKGDHNDGTNDDRDDADADDKAENESRTKGKKRAAPGDLAGEPEAKRLNTGGSAVPERVRCSHILVKHRESRRTASWKDPTGAEIKARTVSHAVGVLAQFRADIVAGLVDFGELAARESDCSSARSGGDLGFFGRHEMQKAFEDVAFGLDVGEISAVVTTASGVHLILRTS